jgi:hypothetical protein
MSPTVVPVKPLTANSRIASVTMRSRVPSSGAVGAVTVVIV